MFGRSTRSEYLRLCVSASFSTLTRIIETIQCGCPKRSMGWYHATQLLDESRGIGATIDHVVEPWYLSAAAVGAPGWEEFAQFKSYLEKKGVQFHARAKDVPPSDPGKKRLAIISSRTQINPILFEEILPNTDAIFLEKPGGNGASPQVIMNCCIRISPAESQARRPFPSWSK